MCGIAGLIGFPGNEALMKKILEAISYRGSDHSRISYCNEITFGHNLHSIIDFVVQPLISEKGVLVINCEIYNWKKLAKKHRIKAKNDAELVQKLFDSKKVKQLPSIVENFDGDFAFAYYSKKENKLILGRDIIGVKPLVYFFDEQKKQFAFASEKKALNSIGINAIHLNPRQLLILDLNKFAVSFANFKFSKETISQAKALNETKKFLLLAVLKRIPDKKFALLFSGGLDSSLIAKVLSSARKKPVCFFSGVFDDQLPEPKDFAAAVSAAKKLKLELIVEKISLQELEKELFKIMNLIESSDPVRVGVAATIYFASRNISSKGIKVVFSGLGADELFAGYHRFQNSNEINKDCYSYLIKMYENDLYFEDIVAMANKLELRVPFLDKKFVELAFGIPEKLKLVRLKEKNECNNPSDELKEGFVNKKILRDAALKLKLPYEIAMREKKAAQYGSNFDKAIELLAKKHGFSSKADYLKALASKKDFISHTMALSQKNISIAALISTGKDSIYALHLMEKQGYDVRCLIALNPENKDSFMYHSPTVELAKLQAKAIGKRLLLVHTKGEKEKEVEELEKGLMLAKKMFKVEGICSGALFSNYQRERIERACEKHGLRHFAPLWHVNQEQHLRNLLNSGFVVLVSKIACYGMNSKWLGRVIDEKAIQELVALNRKYGVNIAGEGGEYETLVLDAPLFKEKISVEFTAEMQNENTGEIEVKKAELKRK